jgi:hypothetical protein
MVAEHLKVESYKGHTPALTQNEMAYKLRKTIFSQLMEFLPIYGFRKWIERYNGNCSIRTPLIYLYGSPRQYCLQSGGNHENISTWMKWLILVMRGESWVGLASDGKCDYDYVCN